MPQDSPSYAHLAGAEINTFTLRFGSEALEKIFQTDRIQDLRAQITRWMGWTIVFFASLGIVEAFALPTYLFTAFVLRYALCIPTFGFAYYMTVRRSFERYVAPTIVGCSVLGAVATSAMFVLTDSGNKDLYELTLFLLVLFVYGNMGISFFQSVCLSTAIVSIFLGTRLAFGQLTLDPAGITHLGFIAVGDIIALFTTYNHELSVRRLYRSRLVISDQSRAGQEMQNQLRQAQKMEIVGRLAGGIAHDFNNLLQLILGYTELASAATLPTTKLHRHLQTVRESAMRASDLVRQMLGFSRQQILRPRPLDVNALLQSMAPIVRAGLGEDISLRLNLPLGMPPILADPGALEQIVVNLCFNARDAMEMGGILTLETGRANLGADQLIGHPDAEAGEFVRIAVSDTGKGIPDEIKASIFEPFFTTKDPRKGTGLGLSMVFGLVEQHRGLVEFTSQVGAGTTFYVYFPATAEPVAANSEERITAQEDSSYAATVLVAEDEPLLQQLTASILERAGHTVLVASDGDEAVRQFEMHRDRLDLVVLDMVMPKRGGNQVYEYIRSRDAALPILFTTGHNLTQAQSEFISKSEVTLLRKPFSSGDLMAIVRQHLATARTASK